jgi:hypothetical protein
MVHVLRIAGVEWKVEKEAPSHSTHAEQLRAIEAGRCFVARGAARDWPASSTWSPGQLKQTLPDRTFDLTTADGSTQTISLYALLDRIDEPNAAGASAYLRNVWLWDLSPALLADVRAPGFCEDDVFQWPLLRRFLPRNWHLWRELFIGQGGASFPTLHVDACETYAWIAQIYGRKCVYVWGRDARPPSGVVTSAEELPKASPEFVELCPGDVACIPRGCLHTARLITGGISVSGNFVPAHAFGAFAAAFAKERGAVLPPIGALRPRAV